MSSDGCLETYRVQKPSFHTRYMIFTLVCGISIVQIEYSLREKKELQWQNDNCDYKGCKVICLRKTFALKAYYFSYMTHLKIYIYYSKHTKIAFY